MGANVRLEFEHQGYRDPLPCQIGGQGPGHLPGVAPDREPGVAMRTLSVSPTTRSSRIVRASPRIFPNGSVRRLCSSSAARTWRLSWRRTYLGNARSKATSRRGVTIVVGRCTRHKHPKTYPRASRTTAAMAISAVWGLCACCFTDRPAAAARAPDGSAPVRTCALPYFAGERREVPAKPVPTERPNELFHEPACGPARH